MKPMMSNTTWKLGAIVAVVSILAAGCSNKTPAVSDGPGNEPVANETTRAPLVLRLRGPEPIPNGGDIVLALDIVVREPLSLPVTLQVTPPDGATLVSGQANESVSFTQTGTFKRQYTVHTTAALSTPVVVTAEMVGPDNSFGLRARREYPAPPPVVMPQGKRPPISRPAMPVR